MGERRGSKSRDKKSDIIIASLAQNFYSRNPTPRTDDLIASFWPKYLLESEEYLDIGGSVATRQHQARLKIWHEFQNKFSHDFKKIERF